MENNEDFKLVVSKDEELTTSMKRINSKKHNLNFAIFFETILPVIEEIKSEIGVLLVLSLNSELGICHISRYAKESYSSQLGITVNTFNSQLYRLQKKGMVEIIKGKGAVIVNPKFVWKGTVGSREAVIDQMVKEAIKSGVNGVQQETESNKS